MRRALLGSGPLHRRASRDLGALRGLRALRGLGHTGLLRGGGGGLLGWPPCNRRCLSTAARACPDRGLRVDRGDRMEPEKGRRNGQGADPQGPTAEM